MRKSLWSPDEDEKLRRYVATHGCGNWSDVAKQTGLHRCGKSCRLRWINYLRPDLKRGPFSAHEVRLVVNLHNTMGNSWSKIATQLPGRTDNDVKNFWHSYTRSRRTQQQQYADNGRQISDVNIKTNDKKVCSSLEQYHNSDMHKSMIEQEHIINNKGHDYKDLKHLHHLVLPTNAININIKGPPANCIKDSSKSTNINPQQIHLSICKPSDPYSTHNALSHTNMHRAISFDHPKHNVSYNSQPDTHLLTQEANSMNSLINSDTRSISIANVQPHDAAGAAISTFYKGFQPHNQSSSKGSLISFQHFPPLIEASDHSGMFNALPCSYGNEINCTIKLQSAVNSSNSRISCSIPHEYPQNSRALAADYPAATINPARTMPANSYGAIKDEDADFKPPEGLESVIWSYLKGQPEAPLASDPSDHYNKAQYIASNHHQHHHNHVNKPQLALPSCLSSDQSPHQLSSDQYINLESLSYTSPSNLQYLQAQFLADCLS